MMNSNLFLILFAAFCGFVYSQTHKPANELHPDSYKNYHMPSARHTYRKRAAEITVDAIDGYLDKDIARRWNEVLLSSIRRDQARPTTHARNLFHTSLCMWESWRMYFQKYEESQGRMANPVVYKVEPLDILPKQERDAGVAETMSYCLYGLLKYRFELSPGRNASYEMFDRMMDTLGYETNVTVDTANDAAALGIKMARAIHDEYGTKDGSCQEQDYNCVNEDGTPFYVPKNKYPLNPYWNGPGVIEDPNHWQRLEIGEFIDQAGVAVNGYPPFTGPQWGYVKPFALRKDVEGRKNFNNETRANIPDEFDGVYFDPGHPPYLHTPTHQQFLDNFTVVAKVQVFLDNQRDEEWNQSPQHSRLGSNNKFCVTKGCDMKESYEPCINVGDGYLYNPTTGEPYPDNFVKRSDYTRILAEFWADGPASETPPGHWNTITNYIMDHPAFEARWGGAGGHMDPLEYSVRAYLALNGALHDAAVASWGIKHHYDYARPVSSIRYMSSLGQSSDPEGLSYHPDGLPLLTGHSRVLRAQDVCRANCGNYSTSDYGWTPGPDSYQGFTAINKTLIKAWGFDNFCSGVCWKPGANWNPYQRPSFVTPPFAGYVSGHSTFSRTAADMLTFITGDKFFPGGMGTFYAEQNNFLVFEEGPSRDSYLQWATYGDASDECSLSRIYGGIHPPADDLPGRRIGRLVARRAWEKLTTEVFGEPSGSRFAVDVEFKMTTQARWGSEVAAMNWARSLGIKAHGDATQEAGEDTGILTGQKYEGVTARLLPPGPGQSNNTRRIVLLGAHPDAGAFLVQRLHNEAAVKTVTPLECNGVECAPKEEVGDATLLVVVVLSVLFVLACVGVGAAVMSKRERNNAVEPQD